MSEEETTPEDQGPVTPEKKPEEKKESQQEDKKNSEQPKPTETSSEFKLEKKHVIAIGVIVALAFAIYLMMPEQADAEAQQQQVAITPPANLDETVAQVNGEKITRGDVQRSKELLQAQTGGQQVSDVIALDQLIAEKLVEQEAEAQGIVIPEAEAEAQVEAVITQQGFTIDEVQVQLAQSGESYDELIERYQSRLKQQKLLESILEERSDSIEITELEMQAFYDGNQDLFAPPGEDVPSFEELESDIEGFLTQQAREQLIRDYITELRDKSEIEVYGTPQGQNTVTLPTIQSDAQ